MHRLLVARECGDDAYGIDDVLSERWTELEEDPSRSVHCSADHLSFLDIDRPSGSLILWGGFRDSYVSRYKSLLGINRYAEPGEKPEIDPIVEVDDSQLNGYTCGRWYPRDPILFFTGSISGQLAVWDADRCSVVQRFEAAKSAVTTAEMSHAPNAHGQLIASGYEESRAVILADMASGAATHRLVGHGCPIRSIAWAPLNPHILASIDVDGQSCLFDIRRSGRAACLLKFDRERKMPTAKSLFGGHPDMGGLESLTTGGTMDRPQRMPLGLGCAWNQRGMSRRHSHRRGRYPALSHVQFSPDGSQVLDGNHKRLSVWDVVTGLLVRDVYMEALSMGEFNQHLIEVTPDGEHILFVNCHGQLTVADMEDGGIVHIARAKLDATAMVLHPRNEEVVFVNNGRQRRIGCFTAERRKSDVVKSVPGVRSEDFLF